MSTQPFLPIDELQPTFVIGALSETEDWGFQLADISDAHQHTRGAGVTVAVLDTGGPNHLDLNVNLLPACNVSTSDVAEDKQGHGCIIGSDVIYTKQDGLIKIEDFYDRAVKKTEHIYINNFDHV